MGEPVLMWAPDRERIKASRLMSFMRMVSERYDIRIPDYQALYRWSIDEREQFWPLVWDFCGIIGDRGKQVLSDAKDIEQDRWFPEAQINYAENLLRDSGTGDAMFIRVEDGPINSVSSARLRGEVAAVAAWLRQIGIKRGDRVAGFLPNGGEAVTAMLAATSLGAVWTSTSPDFGATSVIERFGQSRPKVLFAAAATTYNGKRHDLAERVLTVAEAVSSLEHVVTVGASLPAKQGGRASFTTWQRVIGTVNDGTITFVRCGFNDPLYILYSSGTTGKPKCIVHGIGGTLLQHVKEHQLHCDIRPGDRVLYYTTCGWMMWNWLVSVMASHAGLVLYDGSPLYPDAGVLWDYAERSRTTLFGTSAKYLDLLKKQNYEPCRHHNLQAIRTICSTGSVLVPETFDFVYRSIKQDVCLASISGGTDIVSCFVLGCPILPVYRGECQCRGLGMAVAVYDETGKQVVDEPGELVCTASFPSQPIGFWGDDDGSAYHGAYFADYPGIWHHGDFITLTDRGTVIIHGRSDTTLNPGGVRIGTAELYRSIEKLDEVMECIAVGQEWQDDTRIVLFVVLRPPLALTDELANSIRRAVRADCSPRHVPARIVQVDEIPRTRSGKIVEAAVREIVHGRPVKNIGALANPGSLSQFGDRLELLS